MIRLKLITQPDVPLEAEMISPDRFLGKQADEIARFPVLYGNTQAQLGDFFDIVADGSDEIVVEGDLARVKLIGAGMTQGRIIIDGDAGMHLGAGMRGGEITVHGNAGDWAGAEMARGRIHIKGCAGHGLGGAYRGSAKGMNRGLIIVEGNAGNETGAFMRRGLILVMGDAGDFAGAFMIAGTLIVGGQLGARPGVGMVRGSIVTFNSAELLPTYRYDCCYQPEFLKLIFKSLAHQGIKVGDEQRAGYYRRYSGDFNALGKGEILIYDQR